MFSEDYRSVSDYVDRQLIDLTSSTVTVTVPINTSLELFEYTLNEKYTLGEVLDSLKYVYSAAVLGPFSITGDASILELKATLYRAYFTELMTNGSYGLNSHYNDGQKQYAYSHSTWKTISDVEYVFDPTTDTFSLYDVTDDEISYKLENNEWVPGNEKPEDAVFKSANYSTRTLSYSNPDFTVTLVDIVNLKDGTALLDVETDDLIQNVTFSTDAVGYVMEVDGLFDDSYTLSNIAKSHDCSDSQFSTLDEYLSYFSSTAFTCSDNDGYQCLLFNYTSGATSGTLTEEIRDSGYTVISSEVRGTWQIQTIQTKQLLFFYPESTDYYHDDMWAQFWSVHNGNVWEGHYSLENTARKFQFMEFDAVALEDIKNYLMSAPADIFIGDSGESGGCSSSLTSYIPTGTGITIDGYVSTDWADQPPLQLDASGDIDYGVTDVSGDTYSGSDIRNLWAVIDPTSDSLYLRLDLWDYVNTNFQNSGSSGQEGSYRFTIDYDSSIYEFGVAYNGSTWEVGYNGSGGASTGIAGVGFVAATTKHIEMQIPLSEFSGSSTDFFRFSAETVNCCVSGWGTIDKIEIPDYDTASQDLIFPFISVSGVDYRLDAIISPDGSILTQGSLFTIQWNSSTGYFDGSTITVYLLYDDSTGLDSTDSTVLANYVNEKKWYKVWDLSDIDATTGYIDSVDPWIFNREGVGCVMLLIDSAGHWDITPYFEVQVP